MPYCNGRPSDLAEDKDALGQPIFFEHVELEAVLGAERDGGEPQIAGGVLGRCEDRVMLEEFQHLRPHLERETDA